MISAPPLPHATLVVSEDLYGAATDCQGARRWLRKTPIRRLAFPSEDTQQEQMRPPKGGRYKCNRGGGSRDTRHEPASPAGGSLLTAFLLVANLPFPRLENGQFYVQEFSGVFAEVGYQQAEVAAHSA